MGKHWVRGGLIAVAAISAVAAWSSAIGREDLPRELLLMHDDGVLSFVNSEGFGRTRLPPMSEILRREIEGTQEFIIEVRLIGIARHTPPRVFSDVMGMSVFHLPGREDPRPRIASRPMNAWERQALRDLDAGQRLVIKKDGRLTEVAGPIRAADECLGCHKNKRAGDMLGALIYTLAPIVAEPRAK
jgi:hypothetical protein